MLSLSYLIVKIPLYVKKKRNYRQSTAFDFDFDYPRNQVLLKNILLLVLKEDLDSRRRRLQKSYLSLAALIFWLRIFLSTYMEGHQEGFYEFSPA